MMNEINRSIKVLKGLMIIMPNTIRGMWKTAKMVEQLQDYIIDGTSKDHEWIIKNRFLLEAESIEEMRRQGWIPVLDLSPGLTFEYNQEDETFNFKIVIKGLRRGTGPVEEHGILATQGVVIGKDLKYVSILDAQVI